MQKIILLIILCLPIFSKSLAQRNTVNQTHAWVMYFGNHKLNNKWGIHVEAQWRRNDILNNWQQLLLRTGANYYINPQVTATLGYCYVHTYPYGAFPSKTSFPEHRIWQQIQINNYLENIETQTRFRLEQRYIQLPVFKQNNWAADSLIFQNRFRLLTRFSLPFKGKKIVDKTVYASVYNELFIAFGEQVNKNIFDQNRAYIALGYKVPKLGRIEAGYMNQMLFRSNGIDVENNHTLQLALFSNLSLRKTSK